MREPVARTLQEYQALIPTGMRWESVNVEVLKRMLRFFIGKDAAKTNKEGCIRELSIIFSKPGAFQEILENLTPLQRAGISSFAVSGKRVAYIDVLAGEMLVHAPSDDAERFFSSGYHYENQARMVVNALLESALVFRLDGRPGAISEYDHVPVLFAPAELIETAPVTSPVKLDVPPTASIRPLTKKSPAEASMRHVAFAQAFSQLGPIPVTAKGLPGKTPISKIEKQLGWDKEEKSGRLFRQPVNFFLELWRAAGLVDYHPIQREFRLNDRYWGILESPPADQAAIWVEAYRHIFQWIEYSNVDYDYEYVERYSGPSVYNTMRGALIRALAALPDPDQWYDLDDFSRAIHSRAGKHLRLSYRSTFRGAYGVSASVKKQMEEKWLREDLVGWRKAEGQWIQKALTGPLFHLGLIELGGESDDRAPKPTAFRLTPLGRAAIWDVFRPGTVTRTETVEVFEGGWIVQANFEVTVYIDRVTPRQVAFLERIAERIRVDSVTAVYRLTRESVYRGLESGIELPELKETLEGGSLHPLPENVRRTLSDWGRRRDQLTLRREASLLEFQSPEARDRYVVTNKVTGEPVGDRYFLLEKSADAPRNLRRILYEPEPPRCLTIRESGEVVIAPELKDFLICSEIGAFCEATDSELSWRLTGESVRRAAGAGWTASGILDALKYRAGSPVPPLIEFALRGWVSGASRPGQLAIPDAPVLLTSDHTIAAALWRTRSFRKFFYGRLGDWAFLVRPETADELREKLTEFGLAPGCEVIVTREMD